MDASGWFVWMEMNNVHGHPILKIMLMNILKTFDAEILKIFKSTRPQLKN